MSSATETINKLSEALNTLIKAYEELQNDNNDLQNVITQLKQEKAKVEEEKAKVEEEKVKVEEENNSLLNNVEALSDNTEQQNSSMYNMLDKIESLLGSDVQKSSEVPKIETCIDDVISEESNNSEPEVDNEVISLLDEEEKDAPSEEKDNKIDLNRMASLLNGFNK
jgi:predicted  nucleic acid-binding Zn-ribbon protein